jgi:adenylate cyclase
MLDRGVATSPGAAAPDPWLVLVVDDDRSVHEVTSLALEGFQFEGRALHVLNAYSGAEAREVMRGRPDVALILLDVVMESTTAGLDLIDFVRNNLGNHSVRIVLRTGQPGQVPERRVIVTYDISDFKTKVELTAGKLFTSVVSSLRTYRHIHDLAVHQRLAEATARALQRFFPRQYLELLGRASITDLQLGDQTQREMTVLFAHIRGFSDRAQSLSPAQCFAVINDLFAEICPIIRLHGGIIDKFLGDGFLALFPGSAEDAVLASLAVARRIQARNELRHDDLHMAMGLHTGLLMLGTVGEDERVEATVLSSAVNLASRVESLTNRFGATIMLSAATVLRLADPSAYGLRSIGQTRVPGSESEVQLYELIDADPEELRAGKQAMAAEFTRGVELCQTGAFAEACNLLQRVVDACPGDAAARLYLRLAAEGVLSGLRARS